MLSTTKRTASCSFTAKAIVHWGDIMSVIGVGEKGRTNERAKKIDRQIVYYSIFDFGHNGLPKNK